MRTGSAPTLAGATLAIGSLDLLFAWGYWAGKGVTFADILHSIAAGWYGRASYAMGTTSAVVGALSHYAIMAAFVACYWLAARRVPVLARHPLMAGAAYGLAIYALMTFLALPLSAAGPADFSNTAWVASSVGMHLLIGVLCALAAGHALR
jgi:hypothetical protein